MLSAPVDIERNILFDMAEEFIHQTSRPVFLTGKAGTGKTTFLRHIKTTTKKNTVIVAPTGVAAIHCGGTTIHSFFQLPFTPFVPDVKPGFEHADDMSDKYSLLQDLKLDSEKRAVIRALELLIIDEVSMVRSDTLDAIDTVLRYIRRKPYRPFGGVQVLFIGDLFQLPPVIPDDQWRILREYYDGPFFFQARVLQQVKPVYLELKKIYRQRDPDFIRVLNNVRNNTMEEEDYLRLHERYQPGFRPSAQEQYITLTTHNHKADAINAGELEKLPGPTWRFEGEVRGDFPERNFPTDRVLHLRVGAQVMFIKNDMERVRRYYNGKIGRITHITSDRIVVIFPGEGPELEVQKDTWKNIRYTFNSRTRQVEEEILGEFTQYAIRLAWAVTIHKSQGLTFERAIVDAGSSFAAGQVYVALSRCTSLQGIVLHSRILASSIMTDERIIRFAQEEASLESLGPLLQQERRQVALEAVAALFDLAGVQDELIRFRDELSQRMFRDKADAEAMTDDMVMKMNVLQNVAQRFQEQLRRIVQEASVQNDFQPVYARLENARAYFSNRLRDDFQGLLEEHYEIMKDRPRVKKYLGDLQALREAIEQTYTDVQRSADVTF